MELGHIEIFKTGLKQHAFSYSGTIFVLLACCFPVSRVHVRGSQVLLGY